MLSRIGVTGTPRGLVAISTAMIAVRAFPPLAILYRVMQKKKKMEKNPSGEHLQDQLGTSARSDPSGKIKEGAVTEIPRSLPESRGS